MKSVLQVVKSEPERTQSGRALSNSDDFVLEFAPGVDPKGDESRSRRLSGASDRRSQLSQNKDKDDEGSHLGEATINKHRLAAKVLDRLQQNGIEVREVCSSKKGAVAYALRGKNETLFKQAERVKLRKPLKEGKEIGKTAKFTLARQADFANADDPKKFFSSGERLMLLEQLIPNDPLIRSAQGLRTFANDFEHPDAASEPEDANKGNSSSSDSNDTGSESRQQQEQQSKGFSMWNIVFGQKVLTPRPIRVVMHLVPLHNSDEVDELYNSWIMSIGPQPLDKVMKYFGQARGFYFAFLGSYTFWLLPAAILGIFVFQAQVSSQGFDNLSTLLYLGFLAFWSTGFTEYWKRREATLAFHWDSLEYEGYDEETRPAFKEASKREYHPAADAYRWVYPSYKHYSALVVSFVVCTGLSLAACAVMTGFLYLDREAKASLREYGGLYQVAQHMPMIAYICFIQLFSTLNTYLAEWLTNLEMHRTESAHENARIVKLVTLQFFNYHVSPLYIAFLEHDMTKLYSTIASLLTVQQLLGQVLEVGKPIATIIAGAVGLVRVDKKNSEEQDNDQNGSKLSTVGRSNIVLAPQESLFPEYLEMWVQFSQVTLFAAVFPLAPLMALLNNVVEMKTDALKMLRFQRRSIGRRVSGIGIWVVAFETVGYLGVMTNVALVGLIFRESQFVKEWFGNWTAWEKVMMLVFVEHLVIGLKALVAYTVPDLDSETSFIVRARHKSAEKEINRNFELRSHCQELLHKDRKHLAFRSTSDQGRQLLRNTLQNSRSNSSVMPGSGKPEDRDERSEDPQSNGSTAQEANTKANQHTSVNLDEMLGSLDESMLLQWIMDQEDRRHRAEKITRYYRKKLDKINETKTNARFSEFPQALNIFVTLLAVILLITRESREYFWSSSEK